MIGKKIRDLRILTGLTQKELSEKINSSQVRISQIESDLNSPRFEAVVNVLDALGFSLAIIHKGTGAELQKGGLPCLELNEGLEEAFENGAKELINLLKP